MFWHCWKSSDSPTKQCFFGTIIDTFDAEYGVLKSKNFKGLCKKKYRRMLQQKNMVDWDNANVIDLQTGETVLNSILVEPILRGKEVKGVLYLSRPINRKEYGFNELNFLSALGNVISGILSMP